MTAEDRKKYVETCTICEFMTSVVSAMEISGGLNQDLSDRIEENIAPIRAARDLMRHAGSLMIQSRPLPNDFDETLEITRRHVLEALPKFRALLDEACDGLVPTSRRVETYRDDTRRLRVCRA